MTIRFHDRSFRTKRQFLNETEIPVLLTFVNNIISLRDLALHGQNLQDQICVLLDRRNIRLDTDVNIFSQKSRKQTE